MQFAFDNFKPELGFFSDRVHPATAGPDVIGFVGIVELALAQKFDVGVRRLDQRITATKELPRLGIPRSGKDAFSGSASLGQRREGDGANMNTHLDQPSNLLYLTFFE